MTTFLAAALWSSRIKFSWVGKFKGISVKAMVVIVFALKGYMKKGLTGGPAKPL